MSILVEHESLLEEHEPPSRQHLAPQVEDRVREFCVEDGRNLLEQSGVRAYSTRFIPHGFTTPAHGAHRQARVCHPQLADVCRKAWNMGCVCGVRGCSSLQRHGAPIGSICERFHRCSDTARTCDSCACVERPRAAAATRGVGRRLDSLAFVHFPCVGVRVVRRCLGLLGGCA